MGSYLVTVLLLLVMEELLVQLALLELVLPLAMAVLHMAREKLMLMLAIMVMVPMVLVLSPPQLLFAAVFQSELVTKFLLTLQEKLPRLFARLLQTSRSSRTVQIQSAPLVHNSLFSKHTPLK